MNALKRAISQHPVLSMVVAVLVVLFLIVPIVGFVLYGLTSGSGSITY